MSKPFSENELYSQLASDRTWRVKELSDLKSAIKEADGPRQRVLLRALVAIAYAHWEGHVRLASEKYLTHVALRKLPLSALTRQFTRNAFLPQIKAAASHGFDERGELVDRILGAGELRFARVNADLISTRSNLNFSVFADICLICGIQPELFREEETFIDTILLKRRNSIAHGEETFVGIEELDSLSDRIVALMRRFGDELANLAALGRYRAES